MIMLFTFVFHSLTSPMGDSQACQLNFCTFEWISDLSLFQHGGLSGCVHPDRESQGLHVPHPGPVHAAKCGLNSLCNKHSGHLADA